MSRYLSIDQCYDLDEEFLLRNFDDLIPPNHYLLSISDSNL